MSNTFSGYGLTSSTGNDIIEGTNNADILDLSTFNSSSVTQTQNGDNLVLGLGSNRTITLKDYYLNLASNRIKINFAAAVIPTIKISDSTVTEGNSGTTNANFIVSLSASSTSPVTVQYATANSTATAGSDYNASTGTVTFSAGQTSKTVSVAVIGDTAVESNETFSVNLTNPTGGTIADSQGVGTIVNNDSTPVLPKIKISDRTITEGDTGTTNANFIVTLSASSTQVTTVKYNTVNGTATAGSDYNATTGTVTFSAGQTSKTVSVAIKGDTTTESNERFFVNLANPTNSTIIDGFAIGTIINDDNPPKISIGDRTVTEGNTGTTSANFVVTLSNSSSQTVTINYSTANGNAIAPGDYTATSGILTFTAGQISKTISVQVKGDTLSEANERFLVNLTSAVGGSLLDNVGVGTIIDNEPSASVPQTQDLIGRVETLTGSADADVFTLDNNSASQDLKVIVGFEPSKDLIKLQGNEEDYTTKTGNLGSGLPDGVGIFGKNDQLVAIVTNISLPELTQSLAYVV